MRVFISYHKLPNLVQDFIGDLTTNLSSGVRSIDLENASHNCTLASKANGECMFGGQCRKYIMMYKGECQDYEI